MEYEQGHKKREVLMKPERSASYGQVKFFLIAFMGQGTDTQSGKAFEV
jgi:hypothetical protein